MEQQVSFALPKPGKAVLGVLIAVGLVWVTLAVATNWLGVNGSIARPLIGDSENLLGQPWAFLTAPFVHAWSGDGGVGHFLTTVFGIYFFGPALEDRWGWRRMLAFLLGAAVFSFVLQVIVGAFVPQLYQRVWFGGLAMADAVAVAWALQANSGSQVRLFFVLPISPMMLIGFILLMNVLRLIAIGNHFEGLITPFGGMIAGWAFGDTSPLRRMFLKWKLDRLKAETAAIASRQKAARMGLRVVQGGGGRDKNMLN